MPRIIGLLLAFFLLFRGCGVCRRALLLSHLLPYPTATPASQLRRLSTSSSAFRPTAPVGTSGVTGSSVPSWYLSLAEQAAALQPWGYQIVSGC